MISISEWIELSNVPAIWTIHLRKYSLKFTRFCFCWRIQTPTVFVLCRCLQKSYRFLKDYKREISQFPANIFGIPNSIGTPVLFLHFSIVSKGIKLWIIVTPYSRYIILWKQQDHYFQCACISAVSFMSFTNTPLKQCRNKNPNISNSAPISRHRMAPSSSRSPATASTRRILWRMRTSRAGTLELER